MEPNGPDNTGLHEYLEALCESGGVAEYLIDSDSKEVCDFARAYLHLVRGFLCQEHGKMLKVGVRELSRSSRSAKRLRVSVDISIPSQKAAVRGSAKNGGDPTRVQTEIDFSSHPGSVPEGQKTVPMGLTETPAPASLVPSASAPEKAKRTSAR